MSRFEDYSTRYKFIRMRREGGILEMTFHTDGGPLRWNIHVHGEMEQAFLDVGRDQENEVVILTGCGGEFTGPAVQPGGHRLAGTMTSAGWDHLYWEGRRLLHNLLDIEVPMIAAVNGPATRHAEIPVLCDIVLASENASFQDSAHFNGGLVPGDGMHVVFPALLGANRGRYFLLTAQTLPARQAQDWGLVHEVMAEDALLPRAWTLARQLLQQSRLVRRYTRVLLTQDLRRRMHDLLGYGLALEGLAATDRPASPPAV
ncbi:MAG: enoyl-CoA hydratase/isomerase family protein [Xenophilus sp.]